MHRSMAISASCVLALACAVAYGKGDAAAGKALAEKSCSFCHGPDGNGNKGNIRHERGMIPRIAGQPMPYFIKAMNEYKAGTRNDDDMNIISEYLSEQEIADLAAWYTEQEPKGEATYNNPIH